MDSHCQACNENIHEHAQVLQLSTPSQVNGLSQEELDLLCVVSDREGRLWSQGQDVCVESLPITCDQNPFGAQMHASDSSTPVTHHNQTAFTFLYLFFNLALNSSNLFLFTGLVTFVKSSSTSFITPSILAINFL